MPRPTNKSDLLALSQKNYESLLALIEQIPLEQQSTPFEYNERDKALRDVLVHLYEWQILLLRFVRTNLERSATRTLSTVSSARYVSFLILRMSMCG